MEKMAEEPGKYEFLVIVLDTILHFYNTSTYPMFVDKITDSIPGVELVYET
jgi:hypothetical protein